MVLPAQATIYSARGALHYVYLQFPVMAPLRSQVIRSSTCELRSSNVEGVARRRFPSSCVNDAFSSPLLPLCRCKPLPRLALRSSHLYPSLVHALHCNDEGASGAEAVVSKRGRSAQAVATEGPCNAAVRILGAGAPLALRGGPRQGLATAGQCRAGKS